MLMDTGYDTYNEVNLNAKAASASPHELVVMLIDGLLDEIERARGHIQGKRLEAKGNSITKCMNILIGLDSALDPENGGEIADNLHQLYDYCQIELYQASFHNDDERLNNVERVMTNIREGWMHFGQTA